MADKKISDLTSGSAIAGTEELPIVQSSTTVKTTINSIKTFFDSVYAAIASPTFTGTVTTPAIVVSSEIASRVAIIDASKNVKSADTTTYPSLTELSYVKDVTSALQTQLNNKRSSTKEMLLATCHSAPINPADATTYYFGEHGASVMTTAQNFNRFQFDENFTVTKVIIEVKTTTNPTSESVSFYLRASGTTDNTITTSMDMSLIGANSSKVYTYTPTPFAVTGGTDYEMKIVTPTWVINPGIQGIVVKFYGY